MFNSEQGNDKPKAKEKNKGNKKTKVDKKEKRLEDEKAEKVQEISSATCFCVLLLSQK